MLTTEPRVLVPQSAAKGDIFPVRALISHPMETGLRRDDQGNVIPRRIINTFTCRYSDEVVFRADFHESVAANPFIEFFLEATASGLLEFIWDEDGGGSARLQQMIEVAG